MYVRILLLLGLLAVAGFGQAQTVNPQTMSHYPVGMEGIKGATLPPPGFYIQDYTHIYFKEDLPDFSITAITQSPRLVFITGAKVFGANYGMDVILPFIHQDLTMNQDLIPSGLGFSKTDWNLGDMFVEPFTLSWHATKLDVSLGYGFWAATGNYNPTSRLQNNVEGQRTLASFNARHVYDIGNVSPGRGYWTHMFTGGATYYFDKDKSLSLSALCRVERSHEMDKLERTPGQYFTVEWGLAKKVHTNIEVGTSGYYQKQFTAETGWQSKLGHDRIVGFGPEIIIQIPYLNFTESIRYTRESFGIGRPIGNMFNFTITKRLGHASD